MRSMTNRALRSLAGLAVVVVVLAGCGGGAEPTDSASTSTEAAAFATVEQIDGATRYEVEGVGILVPEGTDAEESALSSQVTQLVLTRPGEPRADVTLTVTRQEVDDAAVEAAATASRAQVLASGVFTEDTEGIAEWPGLGTAHLLRGTIALDDGARDVLLVTTRVADGSHLVAVSAEAAAGELEGSQAEAVLRSVQADG